MECVFITYYSIYLQNCSRGGRGIVCVLLLQDLLQSCSRGGGRRVEDMCHERQRAEACVDLFAHHAWFLDSGGP